MKRKDYMDAAEALVLAIVFFGISLVVGGVLYAIQ